MSEMNGIIKLYDFKETTLIKMADDICNEVAEGNTSALNMIVQAKAMDFISKEIIKIVKDTALYEAEGYSKADSILNGAKFSIGSTGDTLNYKDDFEYSDLEGQLKFRKDQLKKASMDIGIRMFPNHEVKIRKHKDADSLLMAEWCRRKNL